MKIPKTYQTKTVPQLLKIATRVFNSYIRERDRDGDYFYCPTCQKTKRIEGRMYHACHLYPAGSYPTLRFDENNVFGGCLSCNYYKHGVGYVYADWVKEKIGDEAYKKLIMKKDLYKRQVFKWDKFSLIDTILTYKEKIKEL